MPHVTGHFCVCHVELWLLFHDFFPVPGYLFLDLDLGTWVPGHLGTWAPGHLGVPVGPQGPAVGLRGPTVSPTVGPLSPTVGLRGSDCRTPSDSDKRVRHFQDRLHRD